MQKASTRIYAIVSASGLLLIGILGFAFSEQFRAPAYLLIINLILGLWGLTVVFSEKKN